MSAGPQRGCGPFQQVVATGIDSLYLTYDGSFMGDDRDELLALQAQAKDRTDGDGPRFRTAGLELEVQAGGTRFWAVLVKHPDFDLALLPRPRTNKPSMRLRARSAWLWREGVVEVVTTARRIADALLGDPQVQTPRLWRERVSRVDVCVDWQAGPGGWTPSLSGDGDQFVSRANHKRTDVGAVFFEDRQQLTGVSFGKTPMMVRIYDKTVEIGLSDKAWFREIWKAHALRHGRVYDPARPVWRLEIQVQSGALSTIVHRGKPPTTVDETLEALPGIWRYMLTDWLRLVVPDPDDSNRRRWPTDPRWTELADAFGCDPNDTISRNHQRQPKVENLVRRFLPSLAHASALTHPQDRPSPEGAVQLLDKEIAHELERRETDFESLVASFLPRGEEPGPAHTERQEEHHAND